MIFKISIDTFDIDFNKADYIELLKIPIVLGILILSTWIVYLTES